MKIISNFRDYYDYVPHLYGGGDPKIVFVRPKKNINLIDFVNLTSFEGVVFAKINSLRHRLSNRQDPYRSQLIVIGDKIFYYTKYEPVSKPKLWENWYSLITQEIIDKVFFSRYSWNGATDKPRLTSVINRQDEHLLALCKHVGRPVFSLFPDIYGWKVGEISPNLGEMGVASFIEAEDMYQNLSYLVGNLMKDSPDISPPVELSDKHRILKHGFDLKTSFRGKVK